MPYFIGYIPTEDDEVDSFFQLAPVTASDVVYDLGSGDGKLLFAALEKGAGRAVGIELDPKPLSLARKKAGEKKLKDRVTFIQEDILKTDLSEATVVLCYMSSLASAALGPKFEAELKYGTRVVMEWFGIPGWQAEKTLRTNNKDFYLYTMPPRKLW